jgi:hypothetical protein
MRQVQGLDKAQQKITAIFHMLPTDRPVLLELSAAENVNLSSNLTEPSSWLRTSMSAQAMVASAPEFSQKSSDCSAHAVPRQKSVAKRGFLP